MVKKLQMIVIFGPFWHLSTLKTVMFANFKSFLGLKLPSVKLYEFDQV